MTTSDSGSTRSGIENLVATLLDRDGDAWAKAFADLPPAVAYRAMLGLSAEATYRRWPQDPSDVEIAEYAAKLAEQAVAEGSKVSAPVLEALILGAFGQVNHARGFSVDDLIPAAITLVHGIQDEGFLGDADRPALVDEILTNLA